jgi:hypothetical protein
LIERPANLFSGQNCLATQGLNHPDWQDGLYLEINLLARVRPAPDRARELLDGLAAGEPARINCGCEIGEDRDRFSVGGACVRDNLDTPSSGVYRTHREFRDLGNLYGGYRVPLPRGRYLVTLHFAERLFLTSGSRTFGVRLEEKLELPAFDPLEVGFAQPSVKQVSVSVPDGFLDIAFIHRTGSSFLCAVEISRET